MIRDTWRCTTDGHNTVAVEIMAFSPNPVKNTLEMMAPNRAYSLRDTVPGKNTLEMMAPHPANSLQDTVPETVTVPETDTLERLETNTSTSYIEYVGPEPRSAISRPCLKVCGEKLTIIAS